MRRFLTQLYQRLRQLYQRLRQLYQRLRPSTNLGEHERREEQARFEREAEISRRLEVLEQFARAIRRRHERSKI